MIDGNPKSIFAKTKNTFIKKNNQIYFSGNRSSGNNLQEAVNKLKEDEGFLPEAGNKLKEDESNLKELGDGSIFVETFSIAERKNIKFPRQK